MPNMAPSRGHRKSQSTSALAVLAASTSSSSAGPSSSRSKEIRRMSKLSDVDERMAVGGRAMSRSDLANLARSPSSETVQHGRSRSKNSGESAAKSSQHVEDGVFASNTIREYTLNVMSLRSSSQQRLKSLQQIERMLLNCCLAPQSSPAGMRNLQEIVSMNRKSYPAFSALSGCTVPKLIAEVHTALILVLIRHLQTLTARTGRNSALHAHDETGIVLVPELLLVLNLLQGLCLMSSKTKEACSEGWALEMLIDLLLLLRAIPSPSSRISDDPSSSPVHSILDLLSCILVDAPENAERFEKLSGLEAVERVSKGSSVSRDARMKCIEFFYFYRRLEYAARSTSTSSSSSTSQRSVSDSSTRSTASADSAPYPPSPVDTITALSQYPLPLRQDSSGLESNPTATHDIPSSLKKRSEDLNFVPNTPSKRVNPSLGFYTPSSRRVSSGTKASGLATVPASPAGADEKGKRDNEDRNAEWMSMTRGHRRGSKEDSEPKTSEDKSGLGLGLPGSPEKCGRIIGGRVDVPRDVTAIHLSALTKYPVSLQMTPNETGPASGIHLNTSSILDSVVRSPTTPSQSRRKSLHPPPSPISIPSSTSASSQGMSRSSTQPSLANLPPPSSRLHRHGSVRHKTKSSLAQSSIPESPELGAAERELKHMHRHSTPVSKVMAASDDPVPALPPVPQGTRIAKSMTSSALNVMLQSSPGRISANAATSQPRIRHSRTSSQLSDVIRRDASDTHSLTATRPADIPLHTPGIRHSRTSSRLSTLSTHLDPSHAPGGRRQSSSGSTSAQPAIPSVGMERTPSKQKRAFPAELTRGALPSPASSSMSSSTKPTPLSAVKRVPSYGQSSPRSERFRKQSVDQPTSRYADHPKEAAKMPVKSVDEKTELLGKWLGHVDQLVTEVERSSWWGGAGKQ